MTELYDPFDPHVQDDPYPVYSRLRQEHPAYWCEARRCWVLSRHEDVEAALRDPDTYSSARGVFPTRDSADHGGDMTDALLPMMIMMDPPRHSELRSQVSRAFTPRRIANQETAIRRIATDLLEEVSSNGAADAVSDIAGPLPAIVIADMLGLPREDRSQFRSWSSTMVQGDPAVAEERTASLEAAAALYEYFATVLKGRRDDPGDDLVSALVEAEVDGKRLSDNELLGFCLLLLVAGHETTTNLLANATVHLAHHPDQRAQLTRHPDLIPDAVEELLRYDSPVQGLSRTLTREVNMHNRRMQAGQTVLLLFGSANRDDRVFDEPEHLDLARKPVRHLAFGHGIHFCIGAALARLEARVVLEEMLARVPEWELDTAKSPKRLRSGPIRGYATLPISWQVGP